MREQEQCLAATAALIPPELAADSRPLHECAEKLSAAEIGVVAAGDQLRAVKAELAEARADLYAYASTAVCPTCGSALDAERLLARSAVKLGEHGHE